MMTDALAVKAWRLVNSRLVLATIVVAVPTIVTSVLLLVLTRATLLDHVSVGNDEIAYQHQIATFVRAGFSGGYYSAEEQTAPLSVSHFSVHGPGFPVIYGSLGRLFGWHQYSGPIFNLFVLAVATGMFLWMVRASLRQIAIAGVVLITSWWVLLMAPVTMQESLHQSVMIVMAAFVARLLHADAHRQGLLLLTGVIILAVSSVLRPTNWIVAIPLVAIGLARRPFLAVTATVVVAAGVPGFWFIWRYLSAPIPDLPIELHEIAGGHGTTRVLQYLVEQLPVNIAQIFDVGAFVQRPFDQHVMFEAAALAGVSALLVVRAAVKGRSRDLSFKVDVFNASALGMALVAFLGFYFDDGGSQSRVTAPFLLLSMLVLVATGCRAWLVFGIIAAQLMVAPSFVMRYRDWRLPAYTYDRSTAEQFQREITPLLPFAEGQGPWCNTLLTNIYPPEIAFVPPGIGLTMGYRAELLATPFKSRYVLLAHKDAVYGETPRFRPLGTTILGSLYLNLAAACE